MSILASRLMMQSNQARPQTPPTAIFGSAGTVHHALQVNMMPIRIGFWPIRSEEQPKVAMGLLAALAYLLERYQGVRVYTILASVDGQPETYSWHIGQSQFDVDDWQIEGLDDNVSIWGKLEGWNLSLEIESDLETSGDDPHTFKYAAGNISELVRLLPQVAADIAAYLNAADLKLLAPLYSIDDWDNSQLLDALRHLFDWECQLFLWLWGKEWSEAQVLSSADQLLISVKPLGEVGGWLAANALAKTLNFMGVEDEFLIPLADKIIKAFSDSAQPAVILSLAVFEANYPQQAYDWLEAELDSEKVDALTFLAAAELYRRGGQIPGAVDVMQAAIVDQIADAMLFRRYADLLIALEYNGMNAEEYVLIDGSRRAENDLLREAVEAYENALRLVPDDPATLSRQLLQMLEVGGYGERLWQGFGRLAVLDTSGEYLRTVIDMLFNVDDVSPAISSLHQQIKQSPERVDLYLNLAAVYILHEDGAEAIRWLDQVRHMSTDPVVLAEIERLHLAAEDPEFEMTLGEITDVISAGNAIDTDDAEFLESIVERVPTYAEAYLLLARAFMTWGESATALETLLDGHKHNPDDPDILALLSELVWDSGESDLALSYLNKGITQNPFHVPLLALAGQFLFEDGQDDAAKMYLLKAESVSPNDPTLIKVRQHIARAMR